VKREGGWGGWRAVGAVLVSVVFVLPLVFMVSGSLRKPGLPPPRTPEFIPDPLAFGNFVPALVVTDGGPPPYSTTYLPLFVYRNSFEYLRYGYASAATLVMFGLTAVIVLLQWRIIRRWRRGFVY
jgi:hypothetical protein